MSVKVSTFVWTEKPGGATGNELVLLLALADVANDEGHCVFLSRPENGTQKALAEKCGMSVRTFIRAIQHLEAEGVIEVIQGRQHESNTYRVVMDRAESSSANLSLLPIPEVTSTTSRGVNYDTRTSLKRINVSSPKKGSRITPSWRPSELLLTWAATAAPSVALGIETEQFIDYWMSSSAASAVKRDWERAWQFWMRRAHADRVARGWKPQLVVVEGEEWMSR